MGLGVGQTLPQHQPVDVVFSHYSLSVGSVSHFDHPGTTPAGPDGSSGPLVARNSEVLGSNPGWVGCLSSRLCIYSGPNCSKAWSVYKKLLKSVDI